MDSANDLLIAVVTNYSWEPLRCYATSLVYSGFKGTKLMFVEGINDEARRNLIHLGFTLLDYVPKATPGGFFSSRYGVAADYLKANPNVYRYVIWADIRDVVFQTDPSVWLENNLSPSSIVTCSEGVRLQIEPVNTLWVSNASNGEYTDLEQDQLCSGTIAGTAEAMTVLCDMMFQKSLEIKFWDSTTGAGSDQGLLNYITRISPLKEVTRVVRADEPFALQANWFQLNMYKDSWTSTPPRFDLSTGLAHTATGETFSILHQYDRDASGWLGDFKTAVERRYMSMELSLPAASENPHRIIRRPR